MAGFAWKWETKNNKDAFDIVIEGIPKRWNSTQKDWVNSANAVNVNAAIAEHTHFWRLPCGTVLVADPIRLTFIRGQQRVHYRWETIDRFSVKDHQRAHIRMKPCARGVHPLLCARVG